MMMVELTSVPSAALPVDVLSDHLRLSSGFADDGSQDAQLEAHLRSAMAAIEARIGKVLIQRQFALTMVAWHEPCAHGLPVAPVSSVDSVKLITRDGVETLVDDTRYVLRRDTHRPRVEATTGQLPAPVSGGSIEVVFVAGYGPDWADVPPDLKQAMLALATEFYTRDDAAPLTMSGPMPSHVMALIEPYRQIRLRGGAL
ncbi:MAG: hypothetical protein JKY00_03645 [Roseicyclus sp.]|nr:hypothetical protein [Roseicyclus sp.]